MNANLLTAKASLKQYVNDLIESGRHDLAKKHIDILTALDALRLDDKFSLTDNEMDLIKSNQVVDVIKQIRERLHNSLKEAKDMVDAYCNYIGRSHAQFG